MIRHDDYKEIRRAVGLSPAEWNRLQREDGYRRYVRPFFVEVEARVYSCLCRSVWCETCSTRSPTNQAITRYLNQLDWRRIRHVILTVDRAYNAQEAFRDIRGGKVLPRLVKRLTEGGSRYLWALEFHADGYPHWHMLIEVPKAGAAGRIGKKKIQQTWGFGLTWETYVRDGGHWKAICGYHHRKGYLAGEQKAHQLVLPEWLRTESRVRKFGTNVPRGTPGPPPTKNVPRGTKRSAARSYDDRDCDKTCTVIARGGAVKIPVPGRVAREVFSTEMDMIDCTTFRGDVDAFWRAMSQIPVKNSDPKYSRISSAVKS